MLERTRHILTLGMKRYLFREPDLPPNATFAYLLIAGIVVFSSLVLIVASSVLYVQSGLSRYLALTVAGIIVLVVGVGELLPTRWYRVSALLRGIGILLAPVMIWLFVR